jgi:type II secretory pathway component GspD/PulD (secretin)
MTWNPMSNLITGVVRRTVAAGLVTAIAAGAWAQEAPPTGREATPDADVAPAANNAMIAFNFENAPWEQVINYFSRAAGVPVIREADVPGGALTFLSPESYDLTEALRVLNTILRTKGMYLRRDQEFLYLGKLTEMPSRDVETFADGEIPENITEDQIITIVIPLDNLVADPISKQLAPLVASYGKLLPLPEQNALVLTETAAQCRRLQKIISTLDSEVPPANQTELFKLKHAKAEEAVQALRVLSQEQQTTFVIGPNGKKVKVDESKLEGLRIEADKRTNSIIVVGPSARIEVIRELVTMIDVPEPSMSREMATFSLRTIAPSEGVAHLSKLFSKLDQENQPTILPLEESGKLTIVGSSQAIVEASALLREIDGGGEPIDMSAIESEPRVAVIPLEHSDPAGAMRVLKMLLNPRQQRTVKMSPTPDGGALVVSAMASDIETVRSLLTAVDVERPVDREVRIVRIDRGEPTAVLGRTQELYALQADLSQAANRIEATLDEAARSVTLVGSRRAIDQFARTLAEAQQAVTPDRESRTFTMTNTEPSRIVRALTGLSNQLLKPADGRAFEAPQFEAVDELDALLVRATADQFETIETLIDRLDTVQPGDRDYRVVPMAGSDPAPLLQKTEELYTARTQGFDERVYGTLSVNLDEATGAVTLAGAREAIDYYLRMMDDARKLLPPDRTMELVDLRHVQASELLPQLQALLDVTPPIDSGRVVPAPEFRVVEQTNDLVVIAEAAQHRLIRDYIRRLDMVDPNRPTFRIVPLTRGGGAELIERTNGLYATQTTGLDPNIYAGLSAELDEALGERAC